MYDTIGDQFSWKKTKRSRNCHKSSPSGAQLGFFFRPFPPWICVWSRSRDGPCPKEKTRLAVVSPLKSLKKKAVNLPMVSPVRTDIFTIIYQHEWLILVLNIGKYTVDSMG